jgi:putative transposase
VEFDTLKKELNKEVFVAINETIANRATYGIPRIKAILKRDYNLIASKYMIHRPVVKAMIILVKYRLIK